MPEGIAQAAQVANAKKGKNRQLSEITLKRWLADYKKAATPAERTDSAGTGQARSGQTGAHRLAA
ncbi:hypothetical protein E05_30830 [Plautia stali symbiont]|nr:hypothetical protein E05_30830 [Plautia stali symbiont]